MIDLHSHLLPNIDDGSRSVQQSIDVLRHMGQAGIKGVVLTPHAAASEIEPDPEDPIEKRAVAFEQLKERAPRSVRLYLGFEVMLDRPFPADCPVRRYTLGGSRYLLVEFMLSAKADDARSLLETVTRSGVVPVVAHPERYRCCAPEVVESWREVGAKIQVDSTTMTRATSRGSRARELIAQGLVDVLAADNHGDSRNLATAKEFLLARKESRLADLLLRENPGAVVADRAMVPVEPASLRVNPLERLRSLLGGRD